MRRFLFLLLFPVLALPAYADDPPKADPPPAHHTRMKWEDHFAQANQAHDGHLTLEEANAGYRTIARHFHDIDTDGKGYVTENDVRAWRASQRANREHAKPAEDTLRPRNAFQQRAFTQQPMLNTSTGGTVPLPPNPPRESGLGQLTGDGGVVQQGGQDRATDGITEQGGDKEAEQVVGEAGVTR